MSWLGAITRRLFRRVRHLSARELLRLQKDNSGLVIFDVRSEEEYRISHLRGAIHLDETSDPAPFLASLPLNQMIVCYCSAGYRASRMARKVARLGYKNTYNLEGGIFDWANQGLPLESENKTTTKVHPYNFLGTLLLKDHHRQK